MFLRKNPAASKNANGFIRPKKREVEQEDDDCVEIKLAVETLAEEEKVNVSISSQTSNLGFKLVKKSK